MHTLVGLAKWNGICVRRSIGREVNKIYIAGHLWGAPIILPYMAFLSVNIALVNVLFYICLLNVFFFRGSRISDVSTISKFLICKKWK